MFSVCGPFGGQIAIYDWRISSADETFLALRSATKLQHLPVLQNIKWLPSVWKPWDPKLIWEDIIYTPFSLKAEIFTVAAKLKALARALFEVGPRAWLHIEGVSDIFSDHLWLFGLQETSIHPDWLYGAIFSDCFLKTSLPSTPVA